MSIPLPVIKCCNDQRVSKNISLFFFPPSQRCSPRDIDNSNHIYSPLQVILKYVVHKINSPINSKIQRIQKAS